MPLPNVNIKNSTGTCAIPVDLETMKEFVQFAQRHAIKGMKSCMPNYHLSSVIVNSSLNVYRYLKNSESRIPLSQVICRGLDSTMKVMRKLLNKFY